MFPVDGSLHHEPGTITECGIYPALDESLGHFTTEDAENVAAVVGSENWPEYIDVINALNNVDLPVQLQVCDVAYLPRHCLFICFCVYFTEFFFNQFQDIAANFTCQEFDAYTNLIGMNSICKTRWTGQWQGAGPGQQPQLTLSDSPPQSTSPITDEQHRLQQQQAVGNLMQIDHMQQPLSVEQILSQLVSFF